MTKSRPARRQGPSQARQRGGATRYKAPHWEETGPSEKAAVAPPTEPVGSSEPREGSPWTAAVVLLVVLAIVIWVGQALVP